MFGAVVIIFGAITNTYLHVFTSKTNESNSNILEIFILTFCHIFCFIFLRATPLESSKLQKVEKKVLRVLRVH